MSANITAKRLTITADNKTRFYGIDNPVLTASYSGFVNGETASVLTTPVSLTTPADLNSPPGNYPITASGAVAGNYTITHVNGVLTVVAGQQLQLTGTALQGDQFVFTFPTLTGQQYWVQATDALVPPAWSSLGNPIVGTGASVTVTNEITGPQRFFRVHAAQTDGRLEVWGGTNTITFVTTNQHPHLEIRTEHGPATNIVWHWGDGTFSTNTLLADHDFGAAGVHTNYVEVLPRESLTYFGAPRGKYEIYQGIKGIYGLTNVPNLNYLFLLRESITDLSIAGCSNLVQLHFYANPVSVQTCDQWFIDLDAAVAGPVTNADFFYSLDRRSSASDVAWTNLVAKGYRMHGF